MFILEPTEIPKEKPVLRAELKILSEERVSRILVFLVEFFYFSPEFFFFLSTSIIFLLKKNWIYSDRVWCVFFSETIIEIYKITELWK